jgi:predicted MFS family arabinose efflux permease
MSQSFQKPLLLWFLATAFFAFQFILRLSVGILREEIIQKFSIDTVTFGTLAGYYYLGYAGMQIPIGIMLDKYNFRYVGFLSIAITGIGTLAFVTSSDWRYLLIARFMIGAGSAVGFLSVAKITKTYFSPKYHPLMLGFAFTFGLTGAVFGVTPMKILFESFGYSNTFIALGFSCFAIAILILSVNSDNILPYEQSSDVTYKQNTLSLSQIFKLLLNPAILVIGISGALMVGSLEGFGDVWAIPFFGQTYGMSATDSATVTSFIYIGMCFGGPILVMISDVLKSPYFTIVLIALLMAILFSTLLYLPTLSFMTASCIMFILGIFCCYQVLVFTIVSNLVSKAQAGLAVAVVNCINMSFGHFFHKIMSIMIQYNWNGELNNLNLPIYSKNDFILSIAIIPICCFIGMLGFIYIGVKQRGVSSSL